MSVIIPVKFKKQIRAQTPEKCLIREGGLSAAKGRSAGFPPMSRSGSCVGRFMWKLCKTITSRGSIKNLRDCALSYKEGRVSLLSRSCATPPPFNKSTVDKLCKSQYTAALKRSILAAIWDTWSFHSPTAPTSILAGGGVWGKGEMEKRWGRKDRKRALQRPY